MRSERDLRGALPNPEDENAAKPKTGTAPDKSNKDGVKAEPKKPDAGAKNEGKEGAPVAEDATKKAAEPQDYQLARALDLLHGISLYRGRMVN